MVRSFRGSCERRAAQYVTGVFTVAALFAGFRILRTMDSKLQITQQPKSKLEESGDLRCEERHGIQKGGTRRTMSSYQAETAQ